MDPVVKRWNWKESFLRELLLVVLKTAAFTYVVLLFILMFVFSSESPTLLHALLVNARWLATSEGGLVLMFFGWVCVFGAKVCGDLAGSHPY